ncbi:MAG TPA: c-type cytochrome [Gemmatimonadales bacterium]|jgi:mono/diheme cytochrome c family protein|nr:c-type cytochrome [Gemmatimonadales bacterium]
MDIRTRLGLLLASLVALSAPPAVAQAPAGVTPAMITQGDSIFHGKGNCYACHGANAEGTVGPNLTDAEWLHSDGSYDAIVKQVTTGVPKEQSKSGIVMPPRGGSTITDDEVKAVAAYVYSLSHKKTGT